MKLSTVADWLHWIGSVHSHEIELGLDRIRLVASHLDLLKPACPVVIVGGTNGKGSTVAGLEAIYRAAGYKTGAFTSPILFRHNEYVRLNGVEAGDADFCSAYDAIEAVRGDISLTPFEYHTLAALIIFQQNKPDVLLLEVGLGGRLDAVNIIDADVAVVTSIGIDHTEWLGSTRDAIAREKAGIFRQGRVAVYGEPDVPASLWEEAKQKQVTLLCSGKEFSYQIAANDWTWSYQLERIERLPLNQLAVQNMAAVLMVIHLLQARLPVTDEQIRSGLKAVTLPGRIQVLEGPVTHIIDVAHNPASVTWLANYLKQSPCTGKTLAVFSMLADKDMITCIRIIQDEITDWFVAPLQVTRAASAEQLQQTLMAASIQNVMNFSSIKEAYQQAMKKARPGDRIVIFGSFHTVGRFFTENNIIKYC